MHLLYNTRIEIYDQIENFFENLDVEGNYFGRRFNRELYCDNLKRNYCLSAIGVFEKWIFAQFEK